MKLIIKTVFGSKSLSKGIKIEEKTDYVRNLNHIAEAWLPARYMPLIPH